MELGNTHKPLVTLLAFLVLSGNAMAFQRPVTTGFTCSIDFNEGLSPNSITYASGLDKNATRRMACEENITNTNTPDLRVVDISDPGVNCRIEYIKHTPFFPYQFQAKAPCRGAKMCLIDGQWQPVAPDVEVCPDEDEPDKDIGCGDNENMSKNPCNIATGNKYRSETDVTGSVLSFTRHYNSLYLTDIGVGKGWRTNYHKELVVGGGVLILKSASGRGEVWNKIGGNWVGDTDSRAIITQTSNGYLLVKQNGAQEHYNHAGRRVSATNTNGKITTFAYDANNDITQVTNEYGQSLHLSYVDQRLVSVADFFGATWSYEYDGNDNLVAVVFPDLTPNNVSDNPRKLYHYENPNFPNHLTGITDENGDRYATFAYDVAGKVVLSELGTTTNLVGQEHLELDYQPEAP